MNKQEAIKRVEELYGYGSIAKTVTDIISQIDQPQKVVVPKEVAEWIEGCKRSGWHLQKVHYNLNDDEKVGDWAYDENDDLIPEKVDMIARAWLDGYEVEQEQLYTVEIPNPNATHNDVYILGRTLSGDISIWRINGDSDIKNYDSDFQLTESEIKQDFEWAWDAGFAKEVE
ncbi:DUF1642 domain-containing protein [Streptococcus suis]|nr:DUF1642 domain-containing protein [Streptococcus suis]NQJ76049.1 DUF1642 domain-containing protein [Streptococcus suis]